MLFYKVARAEYMQDPKKAASTLLFTKHRNVAKKTNGQDHPNRWSSAGYILKNITSKCRSQSTCP
ncbi:MAG: hypothetical protein ACI9V8_001995 [Urechidicola sp.]|jgi:hypothetical protein